MISGAMHEGMPGLHADNLPGISMAVVGHSSACDGWWTALDSKRPFPCHSSSHTVLFARVDTKERCLADRQPHQDLRGTI